MNAQAEKPGLFKILEFMVVTINDTVTNKYVQEMLEDPKINFDAIVVEWMYSEVYSG